MSWIAATAGLALAASAAAMPSGSASAFGGRSLLDMADDVGTYGGAGPILYNLDGFELEAAAPIPAEVQMNRIPVDPAVGFATGRINPDKDGSVAYYITDGVYLALVVSTDEGVVLVDAPQPMAANLVAAVKDIAGEDAAVTHLVYSHSHQDHISGAGAVIEAYPDAEIISSEAVAKTLTKRADPNRPLPTFTFTGNHTLTVAGVDIELVHAPPAHTEGDIFVFVPSERVAMIVDIIFPGWTPFRSLAIAGDPDEMIPLHDELLKFEADTFVCGHITRLGDRSDVELSREFHVDLFEAAGNALKTLDAGAIAPEALAAGNLWLYTSVLNRAYADTCFQSLKGKWMDLVAGFDVYGRSHCLVITDFLRLD